MTTLRARAIVGGYLVSLLAFGCAPSMASAMNEKHAQMVASANQDIEAARATVARDHDARAAEAFAGAVSNTVLHERGFQESWKQSGADGDPPRSDVAALLVEAARIVENAVAREPAKAAALLTSLGEMYNTALDPAHAAAVFERALAGSFAQAAFEGYVDALDQLHRTQDVKSACKRESARQAAQPVEGTVVSPSGERPMTADDLRYPFLAACVQHEHEPTVEVALDWASPADRTLFTQRDKKDRAAHAAYRAEETQRLVDLKESATRENKACRASCQQRQRECWNACSEKVCRDLCETRADKCVNACGWIER